MICIALDEIDSSPAYHVGAIIYDDPIHYFAMARFIQIESEIFAVKRILKNEIIQVDFYNEMSTCVMSATLYISPAERMQALKMLKTEKRPFGIHGFDALSQSRETLADLFYKGPPPYEEINLKRNFRIKSLECNFRDFKFLAQTFIDGILNHPIALDTDDEGIVLEKQVSTVVASLFKDRVYHSPQIVDKGKLRELIDILAVSELGVYLFETKTLGILDVSIDRSMKRKVLGIQKQVKKGIGQLVGAIKRLRAVSEVFDKQNKIKKVYFFYYKCSLFFFFLFNRCSSVNSSGILACFISRLNNFSNNSKRWCLSKAPSSFSMDKKSLLSSVLFVNGSLIF